ncbi:MAG: hypothetical protein DCF13_09570 [Flavobacteriaceae bacterium]|nr:MAG: hypothetical protein DCF13_09570 [Flavobacteriaceae bacterium]
MEDNCKNCETLITGNFCSNCGQKKYKRIDRKYLIDELQYTVLHTNKGFFYSVKKILRNPGKTAKEFIEGSRVNHYKPILLTFLLSGISTFISFKFLDTTRIMKEYYTSLKMPDTASNNLMTFLSSYNSLIMLISIPVISIITYLLFRKWKTNYYEHIIMNAYIQCFYSLFNILFLYPILFFLKDGNLGLFMTVTMVSILSIPVIMVWFYKDFFPERSIGDVIVKVVFFVIIGLFLYIGIVISFIAWTILTEGIDGLKKLAPVK